MKTEDKSEFTSQVKSVLIPLGLTAAAAATNVSIKKKLFGC